jgi:hypothetical protein
MKNTLSIADAEAKYPKIEFKLFLSVRHYVKKNIVLAENFKSKAENAIILSFDNKVSVILQGKLHQVDDVKIDVDPYRSAYPDISANKIFEIFEGGKLSVAQSIMMILSAVTCLPLLRFGDSAIRESMKRCEYRGVSFRYVNVPTYQDLSLGLREGLFFKNSLYRKNIELRKLGRPLDSTPLTTTVSERVMDFPSVMTGGCQDLQACYYYALTVKEKEKEESKLKKRSDDGFFLIVGHIPAADTGNRIKTDASAEFFLENRMCSIHSYEKEVLYRSRDPGKSVDFSDLVLGAISMRQVCRNLMTGSSLFYNVIHEKYIDLKAVDGEAKKEIKNNVLSPFLGKLREETGKFLAPAPTPTMAPKGR